MTCKIETKFLTGPPAKELSVWASTKEKAEQAENPTLIRSTNEGKKSRANVPVLQDIWDAETRHSLGSYLLTELNW